MLDWLMTLTNDPAGLITKLTTLSDGVNTPVQAAALSGQVSVLQWVMSVVEPAVLHEHFRRENRMGEVRYSESAGDGDAPTAAHAVSRVAPCRGRS